MSIATWRFRPSPRAPERPLTWFQAWILETTARFLVAVAARRSGKTVGVLALVIKTCLETPYAKVGYCAPTRDQAERIFWRPLLECLSDPASRAFVRDVNNTKLRVTFANGSELYVFGAERPEPIRGVGFDLFVTDETDDPNYTNDFFSNIVMPALAERLGRLVKIGSPKGRGILYEDYLRGQLDSDTYDADYASVQVTAVDAGLIPRAEVERAKRTLNARSYAQEYEATFLQPIGVIYDEFDPSVHVVDRLPDTYEETIVGVDWGTAHRGAMMVARTDRVWVPPANGLVGWAAPRLTIVHEQAHSGMGYDDGGWWDVAREIQSNYKPTHWYCDPATGLDGYQRQLKNALNGSNPMPSVLPGDNEVRPGIGAVREFLHFDRILGEPPRLLIHSSCENLIREFGLYRFQPHSQRSDEFTDKPVKEDDDSLDALRYLLLTHFYRGRGRRQKTPA